MKRWFFAVAVFLSSFSFAYAQSIPKDIQKWLKPLDYQKATFNNGVLTIIMNRMIVSQDMYQHVAQNTTCMPYWLKKQKQAWGGKKLQRVEVRNDIGAQGFALVGGRKACEDLGLIRGTEKEKLRKFWEKNTWSCVAGNCRTR